MKNVLLFIILIVENVEDTEINWVEVYHQINDNVTTHID